MTNIRPPASPVQIVLSVLPADYPKLGEEVAALETAGVDQIQWDVMDGVVVPNLTFGPDVIAACRPHASETFEAHLMVVNPDQMMKQCLDAGSELVIVHAEACPHLRKTLSASGRRAWPEIPTPGSTWSVMPWTRSTCRWS